MKKLMILVCMLVLVIQAPLSAMEGGSQRDKFEMVEVLLDDQPDALAPPDDGVNIQGDETSLGYGGGVVRQSLLGRFLSGLRSLCSKCERRQVSCRWCDRTDWEGEPVENAEDLLLLADEEDAGGQCSPGRVKRFFFAATVATVATVGVVVCAGVVIGVVLELSKGKHSEKIPLHFECAGAELGCLRGCAGKCTYPIIPGEGPDECFRQCFDDLDPCYQGLMPSKVLARHLVGINFDYDGETIRFGLSPNDTFLKRILRPLCKEGLFYSHKDRVTNNTVSLLLDSVDCDPFLELDFGDWKNYFSFICNELETEQGPQEACFRLN